MPKDVDVYDTRKADLPLITRSDIWAFSDVCGQSDARQATMTVLAEQREVAGGDPEARLIVQNALLPWR